MFFKDKGPVPRTLHRLSKALNEAQIPHVLMGAMALKMHGFSRTTQDVDICMRAEDLQRFRAELVGKRYQPVEGRSRRFLDPKTDVTIDILVTGEIAGRQDRQQDVKFPDPSEAVMVDDVPVPSIARMIELKLVTWRFKDWADVVEVIRMNKLNDSFGDQFNPLVRSAYIQCYDQMIEEDRYNPEIHDRYPDEPDA